MAIKLIRMMESYTQRLLRGEIDVAGSFSRPRLAQVKATAEQLVKVIDDCLQDPNQFQEDREAEMDKYLESRGVQNHNQATIQQTPEQQLREYELAKHYKETMSPQTFDQFVRIHGYNPLEKNGQNPIKST